jgi:hypothetical protein
MVNVLVHFKLSDRALAGHGNIAKRTAKNANEAKLARYFL